MESQEPGLGLHSSDIRMQPIYIRHAHKAEKHVLDLGVARDRVLIAGNITNLRILDKGTGLFTLHFHFYDGTKLELNQAEVSNGDQFKWDIQELRITNTAQPGYTVKLLTEIQLAEAE